MAINGDLILFDMDGVLVDVSESYRETIVQTVKHLSGTEISRDLIQQYKNEGGWNNDWRLSERILADLGHAVRYDTVVKEFNRLFLGENGTAGLVNREQWIARAGMLEALAERYQLGIFTGRLRYELDITLGRFASHIPWSPIICADDVENGKPAPDGILLAQRHSPGKKIWYIGDTVDDARSAAAAAVPFIGIAAAQQLRHHDVLALFRAEKAVAILDNINELDGVLKDNPQ